MIYPSQPPRTDDPGFDPGRLSPAGQPPGAAWTCPRCGRVNAPWAPYCDCQPPRGPSPLAAHLPYYRQWLEAQGWLAPPRP